MNIKLDKDAVKYFKAIAEVTGETVEEVVCRYAYEPIYADNFQMLMEYITHTVKFDEVNEEKFYDEIARMNFEDELKYLNMDKKLMDEIIDKAKVVACS